MEYMDHECALTVARNAVPTGPGFTDADVGKNVRIEGGIVQIDGVLRKVIWGDAKHTECTGKIKSVEEKWKGKVQLEDGQEFENSAELGFTTADVGKNVRIEGGIVQIDGVLRKVIWGDAKHAECTGKIKSVEEKWKGKVQLEDGQEFENSAVEYETYRPNDIDPTAAAPEAETLTKGFEPPAAELDEEGEAMSQSGRYCPPSWRL